MKNNLLRFVNLFAAHPLLITGAKGMLGYAFMNLCKQANLPSVALTRQEMDITDPASVKAILERYQPCAVINAAGYTRVDAAQHDEEQCFRDNTAGPALLATVCARYKIALLTFSSDLVFNGRQTEPYVETDLRTPMSIYGRSKAKAEECVLEILPSALMVRTSACFGPWDDRNFVTKVIRELAAGREFRAMDDVVISPTYVPDLIDACLDLLIEGESGIWHVANQGALTWYQFARRIAERAGLDPSAVHGAPLRSFGLAAPRPHYTALTSNRGMLLPPLENALECYFHDCSVERPNRSDNLPAAGHTPSPKTIQDPNLAPNTAGNLSI